MHEWSSGAKLHGMCVEELVLQLPVQGWKITFVVNLCRYISLVIGMCSMQDRAHSFTFLAFHLSSIMQTFAPEPYKHNPHIQNGEGASKGAG